MTAVPAPNFDHIAAMTDERGTFEHADHADPRPEHGYCTDDMARVLVVATREPDPDGQVRVLARTAYRFLVDAQGVDGTIRNRMAENKRWQGRRGVEDCWGRSLWAFGTAAARSRADWLRQSALTMFDHGAEQRSPWPRSMAFAALGAAEVLGVDRSHRTAINLLDDAATVIGRAGADPEWPWPERRLTYANAVLPDAMLAIGTARHRDDLVDEGLRLLAWLIERQTNAGHFSFVPVGGADRADVAPRFDQQPIEAATIADACVRAGAITGDPIWAEHLERSVGWFLGDNDAGSAMIDAVTGGGYDGLGPLGPNLNEGCESSLALLSTLQHARQLLAA
ncbi:MAG TPA: hypothetical protein VGZ52_03285 [Acidimicrobiales bacterium]|jgi:hypothetical protein|nr:hypothetical protein [Acidimicrobiales bacterium]